MNIAQDKYTPDSSVLSTESYQADLVYQNENYALLYVGPKVSEIQKIVVTFQDMNLAETGKPAAISYFAKRNQPVIALMNRNVDWFQSAGFFEAMDAVREFVGKNVVVYAYGSSMGGMGALLSAKRLGAKRVVSISPQFSIDPEDMPKERRYTEYAQKIATFPHKISEEIDDSVDYLLVYDPVHSRDVRQISVLKKYSGIQYFYAFGGGHGINATWIEMGINDLVLPLILDEISSSTFRQEIRKNRHKSRRYLRIMGNRAVERFPKNAHGFLALSLIEKRYGFYDKWKPVLIEKRLGKDHVTRSLIAHLGPPKTGTTSIQYYLKQMEKHLKSIGVRHMLDDPKNENQHLWLSHALNRGQFRKVRNEFLRASQSHETLVLSDEVLYFAAMDWPKSRLSQFRKFFMLFDTTLVFTKRDQASWEHSFYVHALTAGRSENIKSLSEIVGTTKTFSQFKKMPTVQKIFDLEERKKELALLFVAKNVVTLKMEQGRDVVEDFAHLLGTPYDLEKPQNKNVSLSDAQAELIRQARILSTFHAFLFRSLFQSKSLRPREQEKLMRTIKGIDWAHFRYIENPPLNYTEEDIEREIAFIREKVNFYFPHGFS